MEAKKKLTCQVLPTTAPAQRAVKQRSSKEVYQINQTEGTVQLTLKDTEFGDICTVAHCGEDTFDVEIGMRVAKLKAVRRLAQLTKIRIRESIKNKKEDIKNLELLYRRQERTIKRMDKIIPRCGNTKD